MMNNVILIGRLTKDVTLRYSADNSTAVARFNVAIDRGKNRNGEALGTDYPSVICYGKLAENCERYIGKGSMVGVSGRIRTDRYEKNGNVVYSTDVVADRIEFLSRRDDEPEKDKPKEDEQESMSGFRITDDDIPF